MKNIKNLLFDLGGVIMDLKRERCVEALTKLGIPDADKMLDLYVQSGEFLLLENGTIGPDEFRNALRHRVSNGRELCDREIDDALNAFLLGIPVHRLQALRRLKEHYKVYMLSNTNPIMFYSEIDRQFRKEGKDINAYFDGMVASFIAKCSKPDRKIFEYAIEHMNIKPEETLFLDDSQRNLDAAAELGFATVLVAPGSEFEDILSDTLPEWK